MRATFTSRLDQIAAGMERRARAADMAIANDIAEDMRGTDAWKDVSGEARESIDTQATAEGAVVVMDFPWRQLEYGTTTAGARPFVHPAIEANRPNFLRRLASTLLDG